MASLAKFFRWIASFLFGSILIPIALDYFKKSNPTAADYDSTFGVVMGAISAFANLPWVYPLAFILGGLTIGMWVDSLARRLDSSRLAARKRLGDDFLDMAQAMDARQGPRGFNNDWPQNVGALTPRMMSLQLEAAKYKIWVPGPNDLPKGAGFIIGYFTMIGQLLSDGHVKEAKNAAENIRSGNFK